MRPRRQRKDVQILGVLPQRRSSVPNECNSPSASSPSPIAPAGGEYDDLGGPALKEAAIKNGWNVFGEAVVPDELERIQEAIRSFAAQGCGLILTTGGTGIAARDVTPEAIRGLMRVELPGFGEVMRAESMKITPNAILSRNLAAVVEQSLVIALPGQTERRGGMSRLRRGRDSARRCAGAAGSYVLLARRFLHPKSQPLHLNNE